MVKNHRQHKSFTRYTRSLCSLLVVFLKILKIHYQMIIIKLNKVFSALESKSTVFNRFDLSLSTEDSRLAVKSSKHFLLFFFCSSGRLVTGLVREFLEYFDLDFSIAVFDPETNFVSDSLLNKTMFFMLDTTKLKSVFKYHTGWPWTLDHAI